MTSLRSWLARVILGRSPTCAKPRRRRITPLRIPEYREWVRTFPCAACGRCYGIEAAHTGPRALSRKSSDRQCIPLCDVCHRTGRSSIHKLGPVQFQIIWDISLEAIVADLNQQWRQI